MYINQIDELLDNKLDVVYSLILKNKIKEYIIEEKEIDGLINKENINLVLDLLNKYITLYLILYNNFKDDNFVNKITILRDSYKILQNAEILSTLMEINKIINQSLYLFEILPQIKNGKKKIDLVTYKKSIDFINDLSEEELKLLSIKNKEQKHNIIKTLLIRELYLKIDRNNILLILEQASINKGEIKYIEIIDSNIDIIDYAAIESLFDLSDIKKGLVENVYQLLLEIDNKIDDEISVDEKIKILFDKEILIPITDEFLRYHKASEAVDFTQLNVPKSKKIDKIRMSVSKINQLADYYSKRIQTEKNLKQETEKLFYQPMFNRKILIYNDTEEINSIRKLVNMGITAMKSNEYFHDLAIYRTYPYINFNEFKDYGFKFKFDETTTAIRYTNFEFKDNSHYNILNNYLECRVGSSENKVNIVGVALPKKNPLNNNSILSCIKVKNTMNLKKIYKNPYEVVLKKIENLLLNDEKYGKIGYWIFDKKTDFIKISEYNEINQLNFEDFYRYLISTIYNYLIKITYNIINNKISDIKSISLYDANNIIKYYQDKIVTLPKNSQYITKIYNKIYNLNSLTIDKDYHDDNEDKIPGINVPVIIRPYIEKEIENIINIRIKKVEDDEKVFYEKLHENAICQHTITWENINLYKKTDPNKFNQMMFEFKTKYVIINVEGEYVCKSCYQPVDIKRYVLDWTSGTEEGISLSFSLEAQLENVPEYEKYNKSIKNMDKIIEKIALGSNISLLIGNQAQVKARRQDIIKGVIDLINIQKNTLKTTEREIRIESSKKLYGVEFGNYFLFELTNDIFTYSSQDTDKYKLPKFRNILIYMMALIINELTTSMIFFLPNDKITNYDIYNKYKNVLFDGLMIRINNAKTIVPISNYQLLCYTIYCLVSIMIKYNLWLVTDKTPIKKGTIDIKLYKTIIHTYVDLLNSLLEINTKTEKNYLYEIFATKFFIKLNKVYNDNSLLDRLSQQKVVITKERKDQIILLPEYQEKIVYDINVTNKKYKVNYIKSKVPYYNIENVFKPKELDNIFNKLTEETLIKLFKLYKLSGEKRSEKEIITEDELKNVQIDSLYQMKSKIFEYKNKQNEINEKKRLNYIKKIEDNLKDINVKYEKIKEFIKLDTFKIINDLILYLESIIGKNVNINNENLYLNTNIYIINHDHFGKMRKEPIIIENLSNKNSRQQYGGKEKIGTLYFKQNDTTFNSSLYIYDDGNITMYYHGIYLYLCGYKDQSGKIIRYDDNPISSKCYLKINYSIIHKLLYLGFEYLYYKVDNQDTLTFVSNIIRTRIMNLKNFINVFQRILYQIRNKVKDEALVEKYFEKFIHIKISENNNKIFSDIVNITKSIYFKQLDKTINIEPEYNHIHVFNISKIKNSDTILLDYICQELKLLLDINKDDKYTQLNLAFLIIDIINQEYLNFMRQGIAYTTFEVKKFLNSTSDIQSYEIESDELAESLSITVTEDYESDIDNVGLDVDIDEEDLKEDFGDENTFYNIDD